MKLTTFISRNILNKLNLDVHWFYPRSFDMQLNKLGKDLVGIEIGVLDGEHAEYLMKNYSIKKLYLIDPYDLNEGFNIKGEIFNGDDENRLVKAELRARKRLEKFKDRIVWIKKYSGDAIKDIKEKVNFVYIDGAHDYINVSNDIDNYYPIVKKGGLFGGHDIDNGNCESHEGLTQAVFEFIYAYKLKLFVGANNWWVWK